MSSTSPVWHDQVEWYSPTARPGWALQGPQDLAAAQRWPDSPAKWQYHLGRVLHPAGFIQDVCDLMYLDHAVDVTWPHVLAAVCRMIGAKFNMGTCKFYGRKSAVKPEHADSLRLPAPYTAAMGAAIAIAAVRDATPCPAQLGVPPPALPAWRAAAAALQHHGMQLSPAAHISPALATTVLSMSKAARAAMQVAGLQPRSVHTSRGTWNFYDTGEWPGEPASRPIVIVHGMFTNAMSVALLGLSIAVALKRRVLLPDTMDAEGGWSRSAASQAGDTPHGWHDAPDSLLELLQAVAGRSGVDLVGHSYGGWIAAEVAGIAARSHSHLIRRVALLAPAGHGRYRLFAPLRAFTVPTAAAAAVIPQKLHVPQCIRAAVGHIFTTLAQGPGTQHLISSQDVPQYMTPLGSSQPDKPHLPPPRSSLDIPALLIWGTDDALHKPNGRPGDAHVDSVALAGLNHSAGVWLFGIGHGLIVDAMQPLLELLLPFLSNQSRAQVTCADGSRAPVRLPTVAEHAALSCQAAVDAPVAQTWRLRASAALCTPVLLRVGEKPAAVQPMKAAKPAV